MYNRQSKDQVVQVARKPPHSPNSERDPSEDLGIQIRRNASVDQDESVEDINKTISGLSEIERSFRGRIGRDICDQIFKMHIAKNLGPEVSVSFRDQKILHLYHTVKEALQNNSNHLVSHAPQNVEQDKIMMCQIIATIPQEVCETMNLSCHCHGTVISYSSLRLITTERHNQDV